MAPKICVTKLKKEMKAFLSAPPPHIPAIYVNERNMLEWHFLLEGPPDTPYAGGWYIGKLRFPPEYPFKPPSIMMLTPSGRFATGTRLCLSMSDFHPESWNPMWTVASILTGLLSFMLESQITTGSLETTDEEKQDLAAKSLAYNLDHPQLKQMFQQELQAAKDTPSKASSVMQPGHKQDADALVGSPDSGAAISQSASGSQTANAASDIGTRLAQASIREECDSSRSQPAPAALQEGALDRLQRELDDGNLEAAMAQAELALRHPGADSASCYRLTILKAESVARAGDLKAALAVLDNLRAAASSSVSSASSSAELNRLQKSWQLASDHKDRGNELFRQGDLSGALVQYQHSLTAEPKCAAVLCNQATTFSKLGQHAEAVQAAKAALNINNNYDKAKQRLAQAEQQQALM